MTSLRQILASHAPLLLVDAASEIVQAGWLDADGTRRWASSRGEAGTAIFRCLEELRAVPGDAGAFSFCEGPGSVLGVRVAAMALRVWNAAATRPVFAYRSLELVARAGAGPGADVIADARRDLWHHCTRDGVLRRLPAAGLTGALVMPVGFRHWSPLPPGVGRVPYDVPGLLARAEDDDLFRETGEPDAFLHAEPDYAAWTPRIHRAPEGGARPAPKEGRNP
jgi:tRNA threonylcarbamoyladenosine biosynthesis protein TsaB